MSLMDFVIEGIKYVGSAIFFIIGAYLYAKGNKVKYKAFNKDNVYTIIESLMIQAEQLKLIGPDKKQWVMNGVDKYVKHNKLNIPIEEVGHIIESFIAVANTVNKRVEVVEDIVNDKPIETVKETVNTVANENINLIRIKELETLLAKEQETLRQLLERGKE